MARKWEISEGKPAWNFEECEEVYFIAGYEEIKPYIPPNAPWMAEFETHYYSHGNGVAFSYIDEINSVRRRRNLPTIDIQETDVLDYGRSTNKLMKSQFRKRTREEYNSASVHIRQRMVDGALLKIATLQPPHLRFEEWKARNKSHTLDSELSRVEVARRVAAATVTPAAPPKASSLPLPKALIMLKYASTSELQSNIIAKLTADDALEAAGHVPDQTLKDMLIQHSLSHF
jgi:hypothetical protein